MTSLPERSRLSNIGEKIALGTHGDWAETAPSNGHVATRREPPPGVDGAVILERVAETLDRFVVTPTRHARDGIVLWIATTHAQKVWDYAPRLVINSPEKRCGKTRLLEVVAGLAHKPRMTANVSTAALFRMIGDDPPTVIVDEADTMFGAKIKADQNEDLRGLLNSGHCRSAPTWRCVGPKQEVREFPVFAMAALAGIGTLPDTITDRALNVTMRRRLPGEKVQPYRHRRDSARLADLRDDLAAWVTQQHDRLTDADPKMPVDDRAADNWSPLVSIADAAGGNWPARARTAAQVMSAEHDQADLGASLGVQLLRDVARLWADRADPFYPSAELVAQLRADPTAAWAHEDLTARRLFTRLSAFGIKATRNAAGTVRGYRRRDFDDAVARYVPTEGSTDD